MSRFLIVGTGRSGTTYCQAVLRVCGVSCTHQTVFTWDAWQHQSWDWGDSAGEASFMAVPLLPLIREREPDTRVVLVKRSPSKVVASWLNRGCFADDMGAHYPGFAQALNQLRPDVLKASTAEARAYHYVDVWNDYAAQHSDAVFYLESLRLPELFEVCGQGHMYDSVLAGSISKTINTGGTARGAECCTPSSR